MGAAGAAVGAGLGAELWDLAELVTSQRTRCSLSPLLEQELPSRAGGSLGERDGRDLWGNREEQLNPGPSAKSTEGFWPMQ